MSEIPVLVVGAGPVGLSAALELRRHGVRCRIVDRLTEPLPYAKAVGVQPRMLELWETTGVLRDALDAAIPLRGQLVYVNGEQVADLEFAVPADVPYGFVALPQYETERLLATHLQRRATVVERGVTLTSFSQDQDGVTAELSGPGGGETVRAQFLLGCDGAHSVVRRGLGLSFEGGAFAEEYMLGDVEVDWSLPPGFSIRCSHRSAGRTDDLLVCIPLPGRKRYRMSMLVPPELSTGPARDDAVQHGLEGGRTPELRHVQAVLDRLAPEPTVAANLRWSSVFRISHRIVNRYGEGRVFVAGDAAHIHPPTGAQGMNTGIQDVYNLAWKLALVLAGAADMALLASYDAERRPVGEEVIARTVRHARTGFEGDRDDPEVVLRREAQLLVSYRDGPLVAGRGAGGPEPGDRAPDCTGLHREAVSFPLRLFELLRGLDHTLLLYADDTRDAAGFDRLAQRARQRAHGRLDSYAVLGPRADPSG
ncbi:MAG TPA: FAD-dependent monooxygenase, partial [Mycobacteriales bacterium]|nr:FAD-dependent monooxygenase [Mycobacteriales bacterium]